MKRALHLVLSVLLVSAVIIVVDGTPSAANADRRCGPTAQVAGDCIGWVGFVGEDRRVDAVATELSVGHVGVARRFFHRTEHLLPPPFRTLVSRILADEPRTGGTAAAMRLRSAIGGAFNRRSGPAVVPDSEPVQATHGETQAVSLYSWLLHGSNSVEIFYGYCDGSGCVTLGWVNADITANTYNLSGDGLYWYDSVSRGGGDYTNITNLRLRILRDITSSPDSVTKTITCPAPTGDSMYCSVNTHPSMTTGYWYYFQVDWDNYVSGYPGDHVQIQTRRWRIIDSSNWQFIAYNYGG
jgi:hypothetical protein